MGVHFALQLSAQILYLHNRQAPPWLAVLGFPNKRGLQKLEVCPSPFPASLLWFACPRHRTVVRCHLRALNREGRVQVLLPAALCCSVSFVQAGGLVVTRGLIAPHSPYNPLSTLRLRGRFASFLAVAAVPHTTAGVLAVLGLLAATAAWPSTLNVPLVLALLTHLWSWASPPTAGRDPLLPGLTGGALPLWVAAQLALLYIFQIPELGTVATMPAAAWLHIGVLSQQTSHQDVALLTVHVIALAALYLALVALRCMRDAETRVWPSTDDVVAVMEDLVATAHRAAARSATGIRVAGVPLPSPMLTRLPSGMFAVEPPVEGESPTAGRFASAMPGRRENGAAPSRLAPPSAADGADDELATPRPHIVALPGACPAVLSCG